MDLIISILTWAITEIITTTLDVTLEMKVIIMLALALAWAVYALIRQYFAKKVLIKKHEKAVEDLSLLLKKKDAKIEKCEVELKEIEEKRRAIKERMIVYKKEVEKYESFLLSVEGLIMSVNKNTGNQRFSVLFERFYAIKKNIMEGYKK